MNTIGIQLKGSEAILVVLAEDAEGNLEISKSSIKLKLDNHLNSDEVKQFRSQVSSLFDNLKPNKIGVLARNPKGNGVHSPSPISFKLEGVIQLYEKVEVEFIWPKSLQSFLKKNPKPISANFKYQDDALEVAYYLLKNG
jgi:hypothetical protein